MLYIDREPLHDISIPQMSKIVIFSPVSDSSKATITLKVGEANIGHVFHLQLASRPERLRGDTKTAYAGRFS